VAAGAAFLCALVLSRAGRLTWRGPNRFWGALSLAVYMIGFSLAYTSLDAGLGALILFGVVQIGIFAYGATSGARPTSRQLIGAVIAFAGLVVALWPDEALNSSPFGAASMIAAGLGWAAYTLSGKNARNPLSETAANFACSLPLVLLFAALLAEHADAKGVLLAVICGAITSGLGYALWYRVLPELQANTAAVVQLSVPILAIVIGAAVLGEAITASILVAAGLVVAGIGLAVTRQSSRAGRS
jgi:drug/metabolite transporter (DMT)-like permease